MEGYVGRPKRGPDQNGHWYWTLRWTDDAGTRHEKTLGWLPRPDAVKAIARELASGSVAKDAPISIPSEIDTFGDLLGKWLHQQELRADAGEIRPSTLHQYRYAVGWGLGYLADVKASAMTSDLVYDTALQLRAGLAPRTVALIARIWVIAYDWALERGHITGRRLKLRMSSPTVRPKPIPKPEAIQAVLAQLVGWRRAFLAVAAATGARPGEIDVLRREHVELVGEGWAVLHIPDEPGCKTGARSVPLQPWALVELRPMLDRDPTDRLFPPSARLQLSDTLRDMGAGWTLYALRRAAATALASTPGVSAGALSAIMGHSAAVSATVYQDRAESTLRAAMKAAGAGRTKRGEVSHLAVVGDTERGQPVDLPDDDG